MAAGNGRPSTWIHVTPDAHWVAWFAHSDPRVFHRQRLLALDLRQLPPATEVVNSMDPQHQSNLTPRALRLGCRTTEIAINCRSYPLRMVVSSIPLDKLFPKEEQDVLGGWMAQHKHDLLPGSLVADGNPDSQTLWNNLTDGLLEKKTGQYDSQLPDFGNQKQRGSLDISPIGPRNRGGNKGISAAQSSEL